MWIQDITIQNCRSLLNVHLELSPNLNIIVGENASGKTSFLEALTLLSSGRSFRTTHISDVITYDKDAVLVSAKVYDNNNSESQIGLQKNKNKTTIRINKNNVFTQAELSLHLPLTVIHPGSIDLITGSPTLRRSFIDWIAFYQFPSFHEQWKNYQHILKQRNICLKDFKHRSSLNKWTEELVLLQPLINNYRMDALNLLKVEWSKILKFLFSDIEFDLIFKTGLPDSLEITIDNLLNYYKERESYDIKIQRTSGGVHRADFKIIMGDRLATEIASRGQLKLLAISLLLAKNAVISDSESKKGVLLIDDLAAELDNINKELLLNYLSSLNQQLIITMTTQYDIPNLDHKVFHVKHGDIINQSI
jgi:DNA replication and repair protein RecF